MLLVFGVIGYTAKRFGFPLAPMILGVVLGPIAELYLARALSLSYDLTHFLVRPWSLFFLILALFSVLFPLYQKHRGRAKWTLSFMPALGIALSIPIFMMEGGLRTLIAALLLIICTLLIYRRMVNSSNTKIEESI